MDSVSGVLGTKSSRLYRFADLNFDVGQHRLSRDGEEIALSKLSYELVRVLVEAAPNLVTHDELAEKVWGPRRIVTPENLAKRVMMLRQALGDNVEQPRYIEGLRGQGYRLIPEVETRLPQPLNGSSAGADSVPSSSSSLAVIPPERAQRRDRRPGYALAAGLAVVLVFAVLAFQVWRTPEPDRDVARLLLDVRPAERLAGSYQSARPSRTAMALSPDGKTVVFSALDDGVRHLYRRRLEENDAVVMAGTEGALGPFFSPDGVWVGFWANRKLKKVSLDGGPVVDIVDVVLFFGAAWALDDTIVFSKGLGEGIARVAAAGGGTETVLRGGPHDIHVLPRVLPGGRAMLYTRLTGPEESRIDVYRFDTGEQRTLVDGADARFSPSGHLLFMRLGVLMAAPFDAERLALTGAAVAVVDDVMQAFRASNMGDETRAGQFDVAENGTLVYLTGGVYPWDTSDAFWLDGAGSTTRIPIEGPVDQPRVSPDGTRIAYKVTRSPTTKLSDIWVHDIERRTQIRVTHDGDNALPVWSPDGKKLVFSRLVDGVSGLALVAADGGTPPVPLVTTTERQLLPSSWSANDNTLVLVQETPDDYEVWALDMAVDGEPKTQREPRLLVDGPLLDTHPALSPDGRWLAYTSAGGNQRAEVYVQPYPDGEKTLVSTNGGYGPIWAPDGGRLYYWQPGPPKQIIAAGFDATGDVPVIGKPQVLFELTHEYYNTTPVRGWDLTPDGEKLVVTKGTPQEPPVTQMHLVINWMAELERRVPLD